jgi:enoyl-CoA hydratase
MVNKVVPIDSLESTVMDMAKKISTMPRLGLTLTKQAINHVEDLQGKRNGMEAAFAWHHFSHAHNDLTTGNVLSGFDAKKMAKSQRTKPKKASSKKPVLKKPAPKKKKK